MSEFSIAYRYAKALYEAAAERRCLAEANADTRLITDTLRATPELDAFLRNPAATATDLGKTLELLFFPHVSDISINFLKLLMKKRRLPILRYAAERFAKLYEEKAGVVRAKLEYAGQFSDIAEKQLIDAIGKTPGVTKAIVEKTECPFLIGGARLTVGGRLYDSSSRTALMKLRKAMKRVDIRDV